MSTKIEELSDIEDQIEFTNVKEKIEEPIVEQKTPKASVQVQEVTKENKNFMKAIYEKIKDPLLVSILVFLFTHPLFAKGISYIPYTDKIDKTILLALIIGIIFFFIRNVI